HHTSASKLYPLSLHDALPIFLNDMLKSVISLCDIPAATSKVESLSNEAAIPSISSLEGEIRSREDVVRMLEKICKFIERTEPTKDRKSTRLNSSHVKSSYAVF